MKISPLATPALEPGYGMLEPEMMQTRIPSPVLGFFAFVSRRFRKPGVSVLAIALAQAVVLAAGWIAVYNTTHEQIARGVEDIIIDNNRRIADGIAKSLVALPETYDQDDPAWIRAQKTVENIKLSAGGFACILDENNDIVCHPDINSDPFLRGKPLGAMEVTPFGANKPTALSKLARQGLSEGIVDFTTDGKHYIATTTLNASGARLLVHQPVSGLTSASNDLTAGLLLRMVVSGGLIIMLTTGIGSVLIRRHSKTIWSWNSELTREVGKRTRQLHTSREAIVLALAKLADYRDTETGQHVERISAYCVLLANRMRPGHDEINDEWIDRLRLASVLHDIGKVAIPDGVLRKPGKLTPAEFAEIQRHPIVGADTLISVHTNIGDDPLITMAIEVALYHHEKWNGAGYPYGLSGGDIPLSARIVAVADVFDALLSPRVYKPAIGLGEVVAEIERSSGTHFDPGVVDAFMGLIPELHEAWRSRFEHGQPARAA